MASLLVSKNRLLLTVYLSTDNKCQCRQSSYNVSGKVNTVQFFSKSQFQWTVLFQVKLSQCSRFQVTLAQSGCIFSVQMAQCCLFSGYFDTKSSMR